MDPQLLDAPQFNAKSLQSLVPKPPPSSGARNQSPGLGSDSEAPEECRPEDTGLAVADLHAEDLPVASPVTTVATTSARETTRPLT